MSNRDSKGRFVKAARTPQVGDRVAATYSTSYFNKGDVGVIRRVGPDGSHDVDFNGQGNRRVFGAGRWWCGAHKPVKLLEPAPQPKAEKVPMCHRSHPHEDDGCPLNHPQHIEVLRDRAIMKGEFASLQSEIGSLKAEVKSAQDGRREAESKLVDIRFILSAIVWVGIDFDKALDAIERVLDRP